MRTSMPSTLSLLCGLVPAVLGDFSHSSWPPPKDVTSRSSLVAAAFANLGDTIREYTALDAQDSSALPASLTGLASLTFSLGVFALGDAAAADRLQLHHTGEEIASAPNGTRAVDGDSIYRVASVTKVLTVLAGLVRLSEADWDRSLAAVLPALGSQAVDADATATVDWTEVTLRSLAAQLGGVPRDGFPSLTELALLQELGAADPLAMGLPPLDAADPLANPPCAALLRAPGADGTCPAAPYLASTAARPPTFRPWTTPAYADNGFALLGLALANITGSAYAPLVHHAVLQPLHMASSSVDVPAAAAWPRCVVAGGSPDAFFDLPAGVLAASGGAFASTRDLARLGLGILNSTLLPPARTRRWLQPVSHTARLQHAVGAPWEIHRLVLPSAGRVTNLYTKMGDSGAYSAFLVLLPDYGLGFSLLSASSTLPNRASILSALADVVVDRLVPAVDSQAALEAARAYAGTYTDPSTARSSSLTLVVNATAAQGPGLAIASWTSNGTDVLASPLVDYIGPLPWRLLPSIADAVHGRQAFRLVTAVDRPGAQPPVAAPLFSGPGFEAADWIHADVLTYGGVGATLFVFDVGCNGTATAVRPAAFRMTLQRA